MTDLNLHSIYYPYTRNNETNGGTIIAAYNLGQSSLIWQSLSEFDTIELVLQQLMQLHKSSSNIRDYFQGGKIQNWCGDPYAHGAFARFIPFQETELFSPLQTSVSQVHFIGEHTTILHGWLEGAIVSALHGALSVTREKQTIFDVIIIGGNPVGLMTSIFLSLKQPNLRIAIIEENTIMNWKFSQEHFHEGFDEEYLIQLANISFTLWQQLGQMSNLSFGSILNTDDGMLILSNPNITQTTIKSKWTSMKHTCKEFYMNCKYLNNTELHLSYPMFTLPYEYDGIFYNQSGYINVTTLISTLRRLIDQNSNITIREREQLLSLQINNNHTQLITTRGILYASRKVLFLPGSNAKNISHLLRINLNVSVWKLPIYYFRRLPGITQLPNSIVLDNHGQQSIFSGFSIDSTPDYLVIKPIFIPNTSHLLINPLHTENVIGWVSHYLSALINATDYYFDNQTYLITFLPYNRVLLDYVPRTNKRILMHIDETEMTFVPVWADILSDMILFDDMNTSSKYTKYLDYFSFSRLDQLFTEIVVTNKGYQWISSPSLFLFCLTLITSLF